jgi:hypothetical protein
MSIAADGIISESELLDYRRRVVKVRELFLILGRGTRQRAAYELHISPTRIGYVLIARHIDPLLLDKLEGWVCEQEYPADVAVELPQLLAV